MAAVCAAEIRKASSQRMVAFSLVTLAVVLALRILAVRNIHRSSAGLLTPKGPLGRVGVDHCGFEVAVAQQFLDCANVGSGFQQVGCKRVSKRVGGDALFDAHFGRGFVHSTLWRGFVKVVAPQFAGLTIACQFGCGE